MMNQHMPKDQLPIKSLADSYKKALPYINISYVLFGSIAMLGALGWWIDKHSGSTPLFFIIGVLSGFFLGLYNLFKVIKRLEKRD
jgi:F0F1-type ATP synthase assembly protein I